MIGAHYTRIEGRILREADAVVAITDDFRPALAELGVDAERVTTIENWAPLADLPVRPKSNPFSREHELADRFVFAYTGAIGVKQDRDLLLRLAERYRDSDDVRVLAVSGDAGAEYLREQAARRGLDGLIVRDFVPWAQVPEVMGTADVLVASLHADAGEYSVPSKVLAYLCAARPLLVSVPGRNLAGRIVEREGAGLVAPPGDDEAFLAAADELYAGSGERERMGAAGRRYADSTFAISPIARRFEVVLEGAAPRA
jgi:glycosyltransferase involved in cell wall biosynthesis